MRGGGWCADAKCPCMDDEILSIARCQICLEGTPEILNSEDTCKGVCGLDGHRCEPKDCPQDVEACQVTEHCSQPTLCAYMPSDIGALVMQA